MALFPNNLNGETVPNNTYPQLAYITDISRALNGVITFSADHGFTVGEIIGLRVSEEFGMIQLNNQEVKVVSVTSDTATIDVDTHLFNPFINAGTSVQRPCIAVPSSSGVIPNSAIPQTNLSDAYDNLPP
jgi:hypothetical protein